MKPQATTFFQLTVDPIDVGSGRCDSGRSYSGRSRRIFLLIAVSFRTEALEHPIPVLRQAASLCLFVLFLFLKMQWRTRVMSCKCALLLLPTWGNSENKQTTVHVTLTQTHARTQTHTLLFLFPATGNKETDIERYRNANNLNGARIDECMDQTDRTGEGRVREGVKECQMRDMTGSDGIRSVLLVFVFAQQQQQQRNMISFECSI